MQEILSRHPHNWEPIHQHWERHNRCYWSVQLDHKARISQYSLIIILRRRKLHHLRKMRIHVELLKKTITRTPFLCTWRKYSWQFGKFLGRFGKQRKFISESLKYLLTHNCRTKSPQIIWSILSAIAKYEIPFFVFTTVILILVSLATVNQANVQISRNSLFLWWCRCAIDQVIGWQCESSTHKNFLLEWWRLVFYHNKLFCLCSDFCLNQYFLLS